jgi:ribosomal protein L11 methyltransferase
VIRLAVRVRREDAELVLAELLELAPSGVEEAEVGDGVVEYAVYGSPGELPELPDLRAAAGEALVEVATSELPDDWGERWKRFHRPVLIEAGMLAEWGMLAAGECPPASVAGECPPASVAGECPPASVAGECPPASIEPPPRGPGRNVVDPIPGLHVRPPWEPPSERAGVEEIVIDPGQAFGTGAHASTRMCLELLLELAAGKNVMGQPPKGSRGPLLDVGTGSGVLAIAAARLGYGPIVALDNEQESVQAARENALVNGVELEARRFDLRREPLPPVAGAAAPTVLANLLLPLLLDLARSLPSAPADLIAGGLLVEQADELVGAFKQCLNMHERRRRISGEWAAVWLVAADA